MFWCAWCSPCRVVVGVSVVMAKEMGRSSSCGMGVPATRHRPATSILRVNTTYYYYYYLYMPSVPCRRFVACKISLELRGSRILNEICRNISRPRRVPPSAAGGLSRRRTWRHLAEKVGTSKGGGKQWQPTPKNLHRMQCARAIPVAWLGSGSC
jgi:hypothetical protein